MERNKPNYYGILPASVRYDSRLNPMAIILYSELTALSNKLGYCNAKNQYFAELYGKHKTTISKWINALERCQHIKCVIKRDGKIVIERRIYPVARNATPVAADATPIAADATPPLQQMQPPIAADASINSTSINSTSINNMDTPSKNLCILYIQEKVKDQDIDIEQFSIDLAEDFIDHYESVGWMIGKGRQMKSWRHAMNRWIKKQLKKQKNGSNKFGSTTKSAAQEALANLNREEF